MFIEIIRFIISVFKNSGGGKQKTYTLRVTKPFRDFKVDDIIIIRTKHGICGDKYVVLQVE